MIVSLVFLEFGYVGFLTLLHPRGLTWLLGESFPVPYSWR